MAGDGIPSPRDPIDGYSRANATADITPDTHVRMSVAKFWSIVAGLTVTVAVAVASGVSYWFGRVGAIETKLDQHLGNKGLHLDEAYHMDHGRPVGKWDLDVAETQWKQGLEQVNSEQKRTNELLLESMARHRR